MCGICGFIKKDGGAVDKAVFQKMTDIIQHRGPDAEGFFYSNNFAMSHRRLSILDLSNYGTQPMHYKERYTIVYNGEVYNYLELKNELQKKGYLFETETDTEVVVAAYDLWGEACLERFNGMWGFAIYDAIKEQIFCARDRFGIKPFYYFQNEECFIFASEIKQILTALPDEAKMNEVRVWDFLCSGIMEYGGDTFFKNIKQLCAGNSGIYDLKTNQWKEKRWYYLCKKENKKSYKTASREFKNLFLDSVKLRLRSDVTVGSCLSGGLDSSAIVCGVSALSEQTNRIHTVSSCFCNGDEMKYDEQEYIEVVLDKTHAESHKVFTNVGSIFEILDQIIWHMDEPFTTTSICAQWAVFEEAQRNQLTVMLDGQGADEQLAGYTSFYTPAFADLLQRKKYGRLYKNVRQFANTRGIEEGIDAGEILRGIANNLYAGKRWWSFVNKYWNKKKNKIKADEAVSIPWPYPMNKSSVSGLYNSNNFEQFTRDMIQVNLQSLLHFEDRNSMAHSIESRVPFLDYRLVESIFNMPAEYKIRNGYTKAVMRTALKGILPDKIRLRISKLGFATPEDVWMRDNQELFRKELIDACSYLKGIVKQEDALNWFDYCVKQQKRDFLSFRIICLGRWIKIFSVKY